MRRQKPVKAGTLPVKIPSDEIFEYLGRFLSGFFDTKRSKFYAKQLKTFYIIVNTAGVNPGASYYSPELSISAGSYGSRQLMNLLELDFSTWIKKSIHLNDYALTMFIGSESYRLWNRNHGFSIHEGKKYGRILRNISDKAFETLGE